MAPMMARAFVMPGIVMGGARAVIPNTAAVAVATVAATEIYMPVSHVLACGAEIFASIKGLRLS